MAMAASRTQRCSSVRVPLASAVRNVGPPRVACARPAHRLPNDTRTPWLKTQPSSAPAAPAPGPAGTSAAVPPLPVLSSAQPYAADAPPDLAPAPHQSLPPTGNKPPGPNGMEATPEHLHAFKLWCWVAAVLVSMLLHRGSLILLYAATAWVKATDSLHAGFVGPGGALCLQQQDAIAIMCAGLEEPLLPGAPAVGSSFPFPELLRLKQDDEKDDEKFLTATLGKHLLGPQPELEDVDKLTLHTACMQPPPGFHSILNYAGNQFIATLSEFFSSQYHVEQKVLRYCRCLLSHWRRKNSNRRLPLSKHQLMNAIKGTAHSQTTQTLAQHPALQEDVERARAVLCPEKGFKFHTASVERQLRFTHYMTLHLADLKERGFTLVPHFKVCGVAVCECMGFQPPAIGP